MKNREWEFGICLLFFRDQMGIRTNESLGPKTLQFGVKWDPICSRIDCIVVWRAFPRFWAGTCTQRYHLRIVGVTKPLNTTYSQITSDQERGGSGADYLNSEINKSLFVSTFGVAAPRYGIRTEDCCRERNKIICNCCLLFERTRTTRGVDTRISCNNSTRLY